MSSRLAPRMPREDWRTVASVEGMVSRSEARLLYALAAAVPADRCVVEVGSYRGRSATALALGARAGAGVHVFAVDPHEPFVGICGGTFGPTDREAFLANMRRLGLTDAVTLVSSSSVEAASSWQVPVGLLWVDGDHRYDAVVRDWEAWRPHLAPHAIVAFHDAVQRRLGPRRLIRELRDCGELEPLAWRRLARAFRLCSSGARGS